MKANYLKANRIIFFTLNIIWIIITAIIFIVNYNRNIELNLAIEGVYQVFVISISLISLIYTILIKFFKLKNFEKRNVLEENQKSIIKYFNIARVLYLFSIGFAINHYWTTNLNIYLFIIIANILVNILNYPYAKYFQNIPENNEENVKSKKTASIFRIVIGLAVFVILLILNLRQFNSYTNTKPISKIGKGAISNGVYSNSYFSWRFSIPEDFSADILEDSPKDNPGPYNSANILSLKSNYATMDAGFVYYPDKKSMLDEKTYFAEALKEMSLRSPFLKVEIIREGNVRIGSRNCKYTELKLYNKDTNLEYYEIIIIKMNKNVLLQMDLIFSVYYKGMELLNQIQESQFDWGSN